MKYMGRWVLVLAWVTLAAALGRVASMGHVPQTSKGEAGVSAAKATFAAGCFWGGGSSVPAR